MEEEDSYGKPRSKRGKLTCVTVFVVLFLLIAAVWLIVRPGVFTIQPIGALPDGITFIYHSRSDQMAFFESPDGLCLKIQGSVNLLCRGAAIAAVEELGPRIILKLPYNRWAYLQSTGGKEFDR